jgi:hypothetical protein
LAAFLAWPAGVRRAWLAALIIVVCARLGLSLFPVRAARRALRRVATIGARCAPSETAPAAAGAVISASRFVPGATCLVRALALEAVLLAHGWPATLRIGVTMSPKLKAHAWVEDPAGSTIGSDEGIGAFTPVVTFPGGLARD